MSFKDDYEHHHDMCDRCHEPFCDCICGKKFSAKAFELFLEQYLRANPGMTASDIHSNQMLCADFEEAFYNWIGNKRIGRINQSTNTKADNKGEL